MIDGLRAIAVLSVFLFHLDKRWLPGGYAGVDIFFVISGFLITGGLINDIEKSQFSLSKFYQRRIARIFPAFFTVALLTLAGASVVYSSQDLASAGSSLSWATLSAINFKLLFQGNYFEISPDAQPFLHCWSLSIEEQFYFFFPCLVLLIFRRARPYALIILGALGLASLALSVCFTPSRPEWAFYLLPTRAWELCAGCLLAVAGRRTQPAVNRAPWTHLPALGLLLIGMSFLCLNENTPFPGWIAILPVAGACALLASSEKASDPVTCFLSLPWLGVIGRMSYSLYLWHWPVFSLVDYRLYMASDTLRLALKIGLSFLGATVSYLYIEIPARRYLNQTQRGRAYAFLAVMTALCVTLGIYIRKQNYVRPTLADIHQGGITFPGRIGGKSVVLMGDSNGAMYSKIAREVCEELGYNLTIISIPAVDPLPFPDGRPNPVWLDSLAVLRKTRPDFVLFACLWTEKLEKDPTRLQVAVGQIAPLTGRLLVLNQPPMLPEIANRASLREGIRPPFFEPTAINLNRKTINKRILDLDIPNVRTLNIASYFEKGGNEVLFLDEQGHQLYQDKTHLSGQGTERVRALLLTSLQVK